jgi:hypothetical protein
MIGAAHDWPALSTAHRNGSRRREHRHEVSLTAAIDGHSTLVERCQ